MKRYLPPVLFAILCLSLSGLTLHTRQVQAQTTPRRTPAPPLDSGSSGRPAKPTERKAAIASIEAQLKAFQKDDFKKAENYQSAGLKQNFASTEEFRRMMKTAYPQFTNYKSVTFGPAIADTSGQHVAVPVSLTGKDGVVVRALYLMVLEGKTYHVEGVSGGARPIVLPAGPSDIA